MSDKIERVASAQEIYRDKDGKFHVVDHAATADHVFFADGSTFQSKLDAGELTGPPGQDGADGKDGAVGPAGADGKDGKDGKDGDQGPAGKDGMACRTARFVVGTSTAGWTTDDCDYLCDGTDDQVEINAAISALPRDGGKVVILAGNYRLTGDIVVKSNVTIEGEGSGTYIAFVNGLDGNIVPAGVETAKVSNVALQGLYIRSYESDSEGLVFYIKRINGLIIRGCNMHGMVLQNCNKGSVSGCTISGDANTDALAIKDSGGMAVAGCYIDGNLELSGSTVHCAITGNVVDPSGGRLCTIAGTASRNAVVGNVSTSGDAEITGTGTDNVCANNVYPGISES